MRRVPHLSERMGGDPVRLRGARIGIVGAGASGIAVGRALARHGFERVMVFERSHRVGGKCWTLEHEGKTYEMGAGAITSRYRTIRRWMREAGIRPSFKMSGLFVDPWDGTRTFRPPAFERGGWARAPWQLARLYRRLARYPRLARPGLDGLPRELHRPASELVRDAGLQVVARFVEPFFTGFGYGRYDETPALYFLKYASILGPPAELLPDGFGALMRHAARGLDVRLGVQIDRVVRSEQGVQVQSSAGTHDFEALVVACPLDTALEFLDASPREQELFSRIRYNPYYAVGARVDGLPSARWLFLPRHFRREHVGDPMFVYRRWGDEGLTFFYGHHRAGEESEVLDRVGETVERLGGSLRDVHATQRWRYFPHVSRADLDDAFYEKVEALQGERRTYYANEALAFGSVETCVRYGTELVQRCFAPQA